MENATSLAARTKKDQAIINRYFLSDTYSLDEAYKTYSAYKSEAWKYCRDLESKYDGHDLKVISHNLNVFTAGFIYESDDKQYLMYITKSADRPIEL